MWKLIAQYCSNVLFARAWGVRWRQQAMVGGFTSHAPCGRQRALSMILIQTLSTCMRFPARDGFWYGMVWHYSLNYRLFWILDDTLFKSLIFLIEMCCLRQIRSCWWQSKGCSNTGQQISIPSNTIQCYTIPIVRQVFMLYSVPCVVCTAVRLSLWHVWWWWKRGFLHATHCWAPRGWCAHVLIDYAKVILYLKRVCSESQ